MITLLIETSTERGVVALVDGESLCVEQLPLGLQSSQFLVPTIERLFREQGVTAEDLDRVIVGVGPGSYTGMRVGVAVAKGIAYARSLPLVGVPSLCGFVSKKQGVCRFAAAIDARIGGVYLMIEKGEPEIVALNRLAERLEGIECIVTPKEQPLRARIEEVLGGDGGLSWIERYPDCEALTFEGERRYQQGLYTADGVVDILYLRKTQAEIERE